MIQPLIVLTFVIGGIYLAVAFDNQLFNVMAAFSLGFAELQIGYAVVSYFKELTTADEGDKTTFERVAVC